MSQTKAQLIAGSPTQSISASNVVLSGATSGTVTIAAPAVAGSNTLTLPTSNGTNGQVMTTNGSGQLSFTTISATSDKITEGNTEAEVVDTGSDGHFKVTTEGTERFRCDSSGRLLVGTSSGYAIFDNSTTNPKFQFRQTGGDPRGAAFIEDRGDAEGFSLFIAKSRGGSGTTIVNSGDTLGSIQFTGADGTNQVTAAKITSIVDGTPGADDMPGNLVFSTTADGASSPTERFRLHANGVIGTGALYNRTTSAAANVYVDSGTDLYRSTSSIKYKTDVETLQDSYADAILSVRPVWYRSTCDGDCHDHSWWGFIAEEVAEIDPRLVHWKTKEITYDEKGSIVPEPCEPEPEGVAYERFVPHLLNLIKRQKEQIEAMEARLTALESA